MDRTHGASPGQRTTRYPALRTLIAGTSAVTLATGLSACVAPATPDAQPTATQASQRPSSAAPSQSPTPTPTPLATPATFADEVARATYTAIGPEGVPQGASIAVDAVRGGTIVIDGECVGDEVRWRLTTAAPGEEQRRLIEGTMQCDGPYRNTLDGAAYTGPVQLSIIESSRSSSAWVVARSS